MSLDLAVRYQTLRELTNDFKNDSKIMKRIGVLYTILCFAILIAVFILLKLMEKDDVVADVEVIPEGIISQEKTKEKEINLEEKNAEGIMTEEKAVLQPTEKELIALIENHSGLTVYGDVYDDLDGDGDYEMFAVTSSLPWEKYNGWYYCETTETISDGKLMLYYSDVNNVKLINTYDDDRFSAISYGIETLQCGKKKIAHVLLEGVSPNYEGLCTITDNIPRYVDTRNEIYPDYYEAQIESDNEGNFYVTYAYNIVQNGDGYDTVQNMRRESCNNFDRVKLWMIKGDVVECASLRISFDEFTLYKNSMLELEKIPQKIDEEIKTYNEYMPLNISWEEFGIDSIMKCSDGYIYINYVSEISHWNDISPDVDIVGFVAKIKYDDIEVNLEEVYMGYRKERQLKAEPYFPE